MYDLNSEFDIEMHKKTFVNYLEVVILPSGEVEYAVPSHQEKLIQIACETQHVSRSDLVNKCPPEYYADFAKYLCMQSGAIALWENYIIYDKVTEEQARSISSLAIAGLYKGELVDATE